MRRKLTRRRAGAVAAVAALIVLLAEAPYINWSRAHPPIEGRLVIRQDAMGDGRYGSRRSGGRRHRGIDVAA
ncbi:MAG: hypothetical protein Q8S13_09765, partial [Dehalococcoidia bacterium]|nr:hypothetical protein [Dehalococcoidia bacterium]